MISRALQRAITDLHSKHGKFRPNLLKLASSNPTATVTSTSLAAFTMCPDPHADKSFDPTKGSQNTSAISALKTLTLLTGIGPATSSLLLSVHAPDTVLFFSDEAFRWLCRGGKESPIKYNWKEYVELEAKGKEIMARLDIGARDLERVAWVIMRGGTEPTPKETAQDVKQERAEKSQRLSKEVKRPSPDLARIHEKGSESPPDVPLKKARTVPDREPSHPSGKSEESLGRVPSSSDVGSLEKQAREEAAIEGERIAAQAAQLEAQRAQIRAKSPPIPIQRHHLRHPKSPSLRASERTLMAISRQKIIPEDKIMKAFEANAKKPRSKSSRTAAEERKRLAADNARAAGASLDIPDAKTLARKASARLREQQGQQQNLGLERQKTDEGKEKKLEAVVEDLKSAGAKIGRVISPPPLRHRRRGSKKSEDDTNNRISQAMSQSQDDEAADKQSQNPSETKSEPNHGKPDSPGRMATPALRQRDGSKFTETFTPALQQEDISPMPNKSKQRSAAATPAAIKRSSSEQKERSPEPQTAAGKRPRRVGTRAGLRNAREGSADDAATITSVDCSGCLNLGKNR